MLYKGKTNTHKYQPLVSKELFDKCEEVQIELQQKTVPVCCQTLHFQRAHQVCQMWFALSVLEIKKNRLILLRMIAA